MSQTVRIGINGLGRIGRTILREFAIRKAEGKYKNIEIVFFISKYIQKTIKTFKKLWKASGNVEHFI